MEALLEPPWWGAPQLSQHKPYYTAARYKPDGSHEVVYKCAYCDVIMVSGYWVEIRNGVRYRVFEKHCPQCQVKKKKGNELIKKTKTDLATIIERKGAKSKE